MKEKYIYHLVNSKARAGVDLRDVEGRLVKSISHAFPEAIDIEVRQRFYTFSLPLSSKQGLQRRLQILGRQVAMRLPALCSMAMRCYESETHSDSRQLFKRVKAGRIMRAYEEELIL